MDKLIAASIACVILCVTGWAIIVRGLTLYDGTDGDTDDVDEDDI